MAITKKPLINNQSNTLLSNIINKGGSSPTSQGIDQNNNVKITIRLSRKMITIIDSYLEKNISKKTRTCWLREAIEEKIKKEIT